MCEPVTFLLCVSSNNNLQIRQSKKFTAKAKARVKETIVTDSKMDVCADEDVPLIEWLHSLAFEARSERLSNKSSRYCLYSIYFCSSHKSHLALH